MARKPSLLIDIGAAKTNKYASSDSGDTVEIVERPTGGLSVVQVDGQGSGAAAKTLSMQLTSQAVALLKDGVRDGVVARAVHDTLFAFRRGKVSSTIDIVSADLESNQAIVTRNAVTPLVSVQSNEITILEPDSRPIGLYHLTRPEITQFPLEPGLVIVVYTDGVQGAGNRTGANQFDPTLAIDLKDPSRNAQQLANALLAEAVHRDDGRPRDDMSVVVLRIDEHCESPLVRELSARTPMP